MGKVFDVIAGMGLLIMLYLFLINYKATVNIITALASATTGTAKTLEGR